jgi:hypothetical protein
MRILQVLFASMFVAVTAGCSIHPLPDDVTRDTTFDIVEKIRCEARSAIVGEFLVLLGRSEDPLTRSLVPLLEAGAIRFADLEEDQVDQKTLAIIDDYRWAGIGLKFSFKITESNDASGSALFRLPFTNGTFTLGIVAGKDKERRNTRVIEIGDSFEGLVVGRETACAGVAKPGRNWVHPITGNIGLAEVVHTYTRLVGNNEKVGEFSDELQYTVSVYGSVNPSVNISRAEFKKLRLVNASGNLRADRTDIHRVKIAFTDQRVVPKDVLQRRKRLLRRGRRKYVVRPGFRRPGTRPPLSDAARRTRVFNASGEQQQHIGPFAICVG